MGPAGRVPARRVSVEHGLFLKRETTHGIVRWPRVASMTGRRERAAATAKFPSSSPRDSEEKQKTRGGPTPWRRRCAAPRARWLALVASSSTRPASPEEARLFRRPANALSIAICAPPGSTAPPLVYPRPATVFVVILSSHRHLEEARRPVPVVAAPPVPAPRPPPGTCV